jgi:hypothetical protein
MADHRAEQILAAVETALLVDGTFEVLRAPVDALSGTLQQIPAACIFTGESPPVDDDGFSVMGSLRSEMTGYVDVWDQADRSTNIETKLNDLRKKTHIALMMTARLGLSFVIDFRPIGADEPELSTDGEALTGKQRTLWIAEYNSSVTDPSA